MNYPINLRINIKESGTLLGAGLDTIIGPLGGIGYDPVSGFVTLKMLSVRPQNTAQNYVTAATPGVTPLTVQGASSQTANLLDLRNASGGLLAHVTASGNLSAAGSVTSSAGSLILADANLYRSAAATLTTDGSLVVGNRLTVVSGSLTLNKPGAAGTGTALSRIEFPGPSGGNDPGYIEHRETTANAAEMRVSVSDDTSATDMFVLGATPSGVWRPVFAFQMDGRLRFSNVADGTLDNANLYRAGANTLKTDGGFQVGGALAAQGNFSVTGSSTFAQATTFANQAALHFASPTAGRNAYFINQSDGNFVLYAHDNTGVARAVWSVMSNAASQQFNVGQNMSVTGTLNTSGTLSQGGVAVSLSTHHHDAAYTKRAAISTASITPEDLRVLTPNQLNQSYGFVRFRFGSGQGVEANGTPYADIIDFSTYADSSGGGVNSLALHKSKHRITHKYAAWGATTWAARDLAYTDEVALLAGAAFTGVVTGPTPAAGDNSTRFATTAYVRGEITTLVNGAQGTLDTLNELAAALGNDPNFASTVTNQLGLKAPSASPVFTGSATVSGGGDLILKAAGAGVDSGDLVFRAGDNTELARVWTNGAGTLSFSTAPTPTSDMTLIGPRLGVGVAPHATYSINAANGVVSGNWFRSTGATGWINETYDGGWHMTDSTWLRIWNNKSLYANNATIRTDGRLEVGANGSAFLATTGTLTFGTGLYSNGMHTAVGTQTIENVDGWERVLQVSGANHAKSTVTSNGSTKIELGMYVHASGFFGAAGGGIVGTRTNHPLTVMTNAVARMVVTANGNVGIGTTSPSAKLYVDGDTYQTSTAKVESAATFAMFQGRQIGAGYAQNTHGIFKAITDNASYGSNLFFEGVQGSTRTFSVQSDGTVNASKVVAPTVEATTVKQGVFSWVYNSTTGSMDLVRN